MEFPQAAEYETGKNAWVMSEQLELFPKQTVISNVAVNKEFIKFLEKQPSKKAIKKNPLANDSEYLPIGYVEKELDATYNGLWSVKVNSADIKLNSVVVLLDLTVMLSNGIAITRSGIGSVPVQLKKGEVEINPSTINQMALQKNFPSAKAIALKNAAQSLGNRFGRSLNRADADNYDIVLVDDQISDNSLLKSDALSLLATSKYDEAMKASVTRTIERANNEKLKETIEYLKTKQ